MDFSILQAYRARSTQFSSEQEVHYSTRLMPHRGNGGKILPSLDAITVFRAPLAQFIGSIDRERSPVPLSSISPPLRDHSPDQKGQQCSS